MSEPDPLRVLLVSCDRRELERFGRLLAPATPPPCVASATDLRDACDRLAQESVDLVLLDLTEGGAVGAGALPQLLESVGEGRVVVLVGPGDGKRGLAAVRAGAHDFLIEPTASTLDLERVLHQVRDRRDRTAAQARTERELTETLDLLRWTQRQVVQQARLFALADMATGIVHSFNNSLTPILGYTDMLLRWPEGLEDRAKAAACLRLIDTAAHDAAEHVRRLQDLFRAGPEAEPRHLLRLDDLVRQAILLAQPKWKDQAQAEGISLEMCTELEEVPPILGSESALREALLHLLLNAVEAMPASGAITLRTGRTSDGGSVFVTVTDQGGGMAAEVRERCCQAFFTTKKEGVGLGLNVVSNIVGRHGGALEIDSAVGRGTTVRLLLPISPPATPGEDRPAPAASVPPLRLLVVDDEECVRDLIAELMRGDGHAVELAENGREGLEKYCRGKFDLVVTDQAMPEVSGDQLVATLKGIDPGLPVILLTGFGDLLRVEGRNPGGADLVLGKPTTLETLREGISQVLAGRREQRGA